MREDDFGRKRMRDDFGGHLLPILRPCRGKTTSSCDRPRRPNAPATATGVGRPRDGLRSSLLADRVMVCCQRFRAFE